MKIPIDAEISVDKIRNYLLLKRDVGDKSKFLLHIGYTLENYDTLINDLRIQFLPLEATYIEDTIYGKKFKINRILNGPNGKALFISTIWMLENISERWKFITLFPVKEHTK